MSTPPPGARRPPLRLVVAVALPLLVLGTVAFAARDRVLWRIGTVREGVLYRSATLPEDRLDRLVTEKGIKTVVNMRHTDVPADRAVAERHGARYVELPSGQVPDEETIGRFLAILDDPANRPVLVHCMHGVGRTGLLCALFRMEYDGWDAERAIQEAQDYAVGGSFYEGQDKAEYLRSYVPRSERPGAPAAGAAGARVEGRTD